MIFLEKCSIPLERKMKKAVFIIPNPDLEKIKNHLFIRGL